MTKKERYQGIIDYFQRTFPAAETELSYSDPYQLLVAVILSAQCTDKRVNIITPLLFHTYPTVYDMAGAQPEDIFQYIKSCSYPNSKAKHLATMARMIVNEYNGKIPSDTRLLQRLPGVGRKTANVVSAVIFNEPVIAVDTHVFRVAARIGLAVNSKSPLQTEKQLINNIPEYLRPAAHHWLILHGRYICKARKPECTKCGVTKFCKYFNSKKKY
jgi:endonuclease-3